MRVLVRHGHFAFYPRNEEDISRFCSRYDLELVPEEDYYTFPRLQGAKNYSLPATLYAGTMATKAFAGKPWEVMKENNLVLSLKGQILVPKFSITTVINPPQVGFYFAAQSPLIQPGSRNASGQQVLSYSGEFVQRYAQLRLSEVTYE